MSTFNELPIGAIIAWENLSIPTGWVVCDGANGTPDLRDKFIRGAVVDGDVRAAGGADTHIHTNPSTNARTAHDHGGGKSANVSSGGTAWSTTGSGLTVASAGHSHSASIGITAGDAHSHTIGNTGSASTLPRYVKRVFIRRNS